MPANHVSGAIEKYTSFILPRRDVFFHHQIHIIVQGGDLSTQI
jgi:hypothetical protein